MNTQQVITLARKNVKTGKMQDSAALCLEEAVKLYDNGDFAAAKKRALSSLRYSVGVFHADYAQASK